MFSSDDFGSGTLEAIWTVAGPAGVSVQTGVSGGDGYLELTTPNGNFDMWGTNNAARAMQQVSDGDFALEARFLTAPSVGNQMQGFLIEEDATNWIRFDVYSDGTQMRAFAAVTVDGSTSARIS
ncbi:MAG: hypothetical protein WBB25_19285, partial [Sulfitobacter sp.]